MMGYGDEGTLALFVNLRYARRTPPLDWKNHLHTTHEQCVEDDDPLDREE